MNYLTMTQKTFLAVILAMPLLFVFCTGADNHIRNNSGGFDASAAASPAGAADERQLQDAPDFTLNDMSGAPFTLSEHKGKVIVLNIWATWCPPCRKEIPDFVEMQEELRDDNVLFVGVSLDNEGWEVVRPFAKDYNINYPLVVDNGAVYSRYGPFRGIPTTFIINKEGKVEYVAPGMVTKSMIQPILQELAAR